MHKYEYYQVERSSLKHVTEKGCDGTISLGQRFSNFFQVGTTFIVRIFYGPPYSWDYYTH